MENLRSRKISLDDNCDLILLQKEESCEKIVKAFVDLAEEEGRDETICVVDLGDIVNKCMEWTRRLPEVKPFYAIKANDDKVVLNLLANLGVNFDCASKAIQSETFKKTKGFEGELERVLSLGVSPDRIVYSHPCKHHSMLKYAAENNVTMTTFDNEDELFKIKNVHPNARCLIRIRSSQKYKALLKFGAKFGCQQHEIEPLLHLAKSLDLDVSGVNFHVGHLCQDPAAYYDAICRSKEVFDMGRQLGFDMRVLDIGGGFSGKRHEGFEDLFEKFSGSINSALDTFFPDKDVTAIAEPGEFMVASALTLATKIIARKVERLDQTLGGQNGEVIDAKTSSKNTRFFYYLNDGLHGSFGKQAFLSDKIFPQQFKKRMGEHFEEKDEHFESTLFGPTCNSIDVLPDTFPLREHQVGEWLYFPNMGAYTTSLMTSFNGMPMPSIYYICSADTWYKVFPGTEK